MVDNKKKRGIITLDIYANIKVTNKKESVYSPIHVWCCFKKKCCLCVAILFSPPSSGWFVEDVIVGVESS